MKDEVYTNKRGEMVLPFHIFASLKPEAVEKSLLPAKLHISRRARRARKVQRKQQGA